MRFMDVLDLREIGRLYVCYLAAGLAAGLWGAAYGILKVFEVDHWAFLPLALVGGLSSALYTWNALERKLRTVPEKASIDPALFDLTKEGAFWIIRPFKAGPPTVRLEDEHTFENSPCGTSENFQLIA